RSPSRCWLPTTVAPIATPIVCFVSDAPRPEPMAEAERHARVAKADGGCVGHRHRCGDRAPDRSAGPCRLVEPLELAPRLLASPTLRPCLDLVPAPHSAASVLAKRTGEALLLGDLVVTLLGHTEEL